MNDPYIKMLVDQINTVGRAAMHTLYPNDIEMYMVALELTDSSNNTIDYLTFPIMPDSIHKSDPNRNSVKKSLSGVTVLSNPSFTPQEISIKGSFGQQFKILLNTASPIQGAAFSTVSGKYDLHSVTSKETTYSNSKYGSASVKTGYGIIKILQAMLSKSVALDKSGNPFRLFFYNLALGESFLVVIPPNGAQFSQDLGRNMIWNYSVNMLAVAPLSAVSDGEELKQKLTAAVIQASVSKLSSQVVKIIG